MVGCLGGWVAGLSKTKTKPNPKLKFELKFGAELCNKDFNSHKLQYCLQNKWGLTGPKAVHRNYFSGRCSGWVVGWVAEF